MNELIPIVSNPVSENNKLVLLEIYKDLAQLGVRKVGLAIETIIDLLNIGLIPLKSFSEKRKIIFQNNMNKYREKIENIDEENICNIPPEIGVPVIERLTYTENKNISDLFINLLVKASNRETARDVHPNYIKLIESLSPDEAKILCYLYDQECIPIIRIKRKDINSQAFTFLTEPLTGIENLLSLLFIENIDLYLTNLTSLGIIKLHEDSYKSNERLYDVISNFYKKTIEYFNDENDKIKFTIEITKGYYDITTLGRSFMECCTNGDDEPEVFFHRALMKFYNNDYECAIDDYSKALPYLNDDIVRKFALFYNRGQAYYYINHYEEAKKDFYESLSYANNIKEKIESLSYISLCFARLNDEITCLKIINEDIGENKNIDLYNVSCIYSVLFDKFKKVEYKDLALKYLEESLENKITPKKYVLVDIDWTHFKDDEDFIKLLKKFN